MPWIETSSLSWIYRTPLKSYLSLSIFSFLNFWVSAYFYLAPHFQLMRQKRSMDGTAAAQKGSAANSPNNATATPACNYGGSPFQGEEDELYAELWQACAGPSVKVPRAGDLVYYFPQGHLEQVADFTQRDGHMEIPVYDLPSKILCEVMSVQLKAEAYTDEVFAQITLIPVSKQHELTSLDKASRRLPTRTAAGTFSKKLTLSDTSTHGGFSIPKRLADECFPPLDMSQQTPAQELVVKDLHGFLWQFRHIYRGQPKRHLLTSGWSTFVNSKRLVAGDTCIFLGGENGELYIGIRRAMKQNINASTSTSVISGHSMQLGILTSASFAVTAGSPFTVYYRPWTNPSEFIVPLNHYMKSTKGDYSSGTRIQMQFEAEESPRRYAGTIIGTDDIDSIRWRGSEWRCLKVQWDAMPDMRPERVCPWNIEPLESASIPLPKRRIVSSSFTESFGFDKDGIDLNSVKHASQRSERDLQGQDYNKLLIDVQLPSGATLHDSQWKMKHQLHFQIKNPLGHSLGNLISFPNDDISTSSIPKQPPIFTSYEACNNVPASRYCSLSNVNSNDSEPQGWRASESRDENEVPFGQQGGCSKIECKIFGVCLNNPELPSPQVAASSNTSSLLSVPPMSQSSISAPIPVSKPSKSISGATSKKKCKKCCSVNSRTCTKVLKHGSALGRSIDLSRILGYDELVSELDLMFDFHGSLINGSSGWHVVPIDDDGDMMLFGDYPWQDFQSMVQKMFICPKEVTNNLNTISSTSDSTTL